MLMRCESELTENYIGTGHLLFSFLVVYCCMNLYWIWTPFELIPLILKRTTDHVRNAKAPNYCVKMIWFGTDRQTFNDQERFICLVHWESIKQVIIYDLTPT